MSKDIKDLQKEIMSKIDQGEIKMKPRFYFVIGSLLTFIGLVSSIVISTFLISLIRLSLRAHGRMSQYKIDQLLENFPWWTVFFAIIGLVIGIYLLRHYDFSYKINNWFIILIFILGIISAGWIIDRIGFTDIISQRGPLKGLMRNYVPPGNYQIPIQR